MGRGGGGVGAGGGGASLLSYIHFEVSTLGSFETMPLQYALLPRRMKQNVFAILLSHPAALNGFFFQYSLIKNVFYYSEVQTECSIHLNLIKAR